ncbi:hypothetical protein GDO86_017713 [Hymenochirus boettgeri]|uniref:Olfactory receptor n=1 Tax=Hymenochirus boettgeri TaxID=247094 RepID=A0A8T2IR55_9PIPI|nr:hypothetical protein GDO86_017713 [Hymenochirus boettgeri]
MEQGNVTSVEQFILLGFSHLPNERVALIFCFTCVYMFILLGNSLIILLVFKDQHLHNPMYLLLANFSFIDLITPSISVPKMISDLVSRECAISYTDCMVQMFFYIIITVTESYFLSVMSFDRYLAICFPLHYTMIMTNKTCVVLICGAWVFGGINAIIHTVLTINVDFCGPNHVRHFFCDTLSLLQLACSGIKLNIIVISVSTFLNGICNFLITLSSYIGIVSTILQINSKKGRIKSFYTCVSHLIVVSLFYGTLIFTYFQPDSSYTVSKDLSAPVIYTTVTPALNPFIYSLRNNDIKKATKRLIWKGPVT